MSAKGDDQSLADVTNKVSNMQFHEAARERVKEANWGTQEEFNYAKYNAGPRDKNDPALESDQPQGDPSTWFANAAKYEWDDDYGDVGPKHEALENILFGDEHMMKQGEKFSK